MTHVEAEAKRTMGNAFALAGLVVGVLGIAGMLVGLATPQTRLGLIVGSLILPTPIGFLLSIIGLWRVQKCGGIGQLPGLIGLVLNLPGTLLYVLVVIFLASRTSGAI